jgi:hypothetical protein
LNWSKSIIIEPMSARQLISWLFGRKRKIVSHPATSRARRRRWRDYLFFDPDLPLSCLGDWFNTSFAE